MMVDREMSPRAFLKPYDVLTDRSYWTIPRRSYSGNSESGRTSFKKVCIHLADFGTRPRFNLGRTLPPARSRFADTSPPTWESRRFVFFCFVETKWGQGPNSRLRNCRPLEFPPSGAVRFTHRAAATPGRRPQAAESR